MEIKDARLFPVKNIYISSGKKCVAKNLIECDFDETLEIKNEIIQDTKKTDILTVKNKLQIPIKKEIQVSNQEQKKYTCKKCARTYKRIDNLTSHQKFECGVMPQFNCQQSASNNARNFKIVLKKSTGRIDGGQYSFTPISVSNTSIVKTLIEYGCDETLEIKEEIIADQDAGTDKKYDKKFDSKNCSLHIKEDDTFAVNNRQGIPKNRKIPDSRAEKKNQCKKCARIYIRKRSLNKHQRYECNVKPQFSCKFCGKRFIQKSHLSRHIDVVHLKSNSQPSKIKYNCNNCSRIYSSLGTLNRHNRQKHAEFKPEFICIHCGYKTSMKCVLSKHISRHHFK
ncbi:zinc finger protein 569-like [Belonocnema kinseyi]|uniref:zinc finger protein 569-like n=1 Tax=Belonocnema kinseyi TaxID=2817044 RepID=UPI00143D5D1C|nr:zinc finger protein 569-like [Belonocnema kinseyi]